MNGKLEDWMKKIDEKSDDNASRIDKIEPLIHSIVKMSDERYEQFKWYMRTTLAAALGTLVTLIAKSIFKF